LSCEKRTFSSSPKQRRQEEEEEEEERKRHQNIEGALLLRWNIPRRRFRRCRRRRRHKAISGKIFLLVKVLKCFFIFLCY